MGIELPDEKRLPAGPARDLVVALHELYRGAGRPGLRPISEAIAKSDFRDTISHEAISDMLNGKTVPRWSKLDCVVRQLAVWNPTRLDPDETAARFLSLWEAATGGPPAQAVQPMAPINGGGAPEPSAEVHSRDHEWAHVRADLIAGRSRWRAPAGDWQVTELRHLKDNQSSHPAFTARSSRSDGPPTVRIGVRVACDPLPARQLDSSEVRYSFLNFLYSQQVTGLVAELTDIGRDAKWRKWAGHGPSNHEAVLTDSLEQTTSAWARLLLPPEPGMPAAWHSTHSALLVMHIEQRPGDVDGDRPACIPFLDWHSHFMQALGWSSALASFLANDLGLGIPTQDPAGWFDSDLLGTDSAVASVGLWLATPHAMTDLIDISGYERLPGSPVRPEFDAYAVGDLEGADVAGMAIDWMRRLCDYTLHLDKYERSLLLLGEAARTEH